MPHLNFGISTLIACIKAKIVVKCELEMRPAPQHFPWNLDTDLNSKLCWPYGGDEWRWHIQNHNEYTSTKLISVVSSHTGKEIRVRPRLAVLTRSYLRSYEGLKNLKTLISPLGSSTVHGILYPSKLDADWSIPKKNLNGPISIEYWEIRSSHVGEGLLYVNIDFTRWTNLELDKSES